MIAMFDGVRITLSGPGRPLRLDVHHRERFLFAAASALRSRTCRPERQRHASRSRRMRGIVAKTPGAASGWRITGA